MKRTITNLLAISLLAITLLGFGPNAKADPVLALPPGPVIASTLLAPITMIIVDPSIGCALGCPITVGYANSWVIGPAPGGPGGAAVNGGLVFAYQVLNISGLGFLPFPAPNPPAPFAIPIEKVTNPDFPFFGAPAGFDFPPFLITTHHVPGLTGLPSEFGVGGFLPFHTGVIDLGGGLSWEYDPVSGTFPIPGCLPGILASCGFSEVMWVDTSAPTFAFGTIAAIDGGQAGAAGSLIPSLPEPSSSLLLGTGLLGLVSLARRKKKSAPTV